MLADLNQVIESGVQISVKNQEDPLKLQIALVVEINSLCNWFKTVRGFNDENEILQVAEIIIDNFWYLKFEEIQFCFKMVKSGKSRIKVLDRLDGSTIVAFIDEYDSTTRVLWSENRANIYKSLENKKGFVENDEFDKEKFYSEGKKYRQEIENNKKVSVGTPKPTQEQKRRQYELILPGLGKEELSQMLIQAKEDKNELLIEMINKL